MGEYDEVFEEEKEKEEPKRDIKVEFDNIKLIINERNKINHELDILRKEYKEELGRLNLYLFGDRENEEYESQIDKLKNEIGHSMTKTHPMAPIAKEVIRLMEDINGFNKKMDALNTKSIKEIGHLLDNSIKLYIKDIESQKDEIEILRTEENLKRADSKITDYMVSKFMEREGQEVIDKYMVAFDEKNQLRMNQAKGLFVRKAKDWFIGKHPDPKRVGQLLFKKYTQSLKTIIQSVDEQDEKNNSSENWNIEGELNQTSEEPLKESEKTRNSVGNGEESDENEK